MFIFVVYRFGYIFINLTHTILYKRHTSFQHNKKAQS